MNGVYSILEYEFNTLFPILKKKKKRVFFAKSHLTEGNWFCITAGNIGVLL